MKEIRILIRNLRKYPDNFFVVIRKDSPDLSVVSSEPIPHTDGGRIIHYHDVINVGYDTTDVIVD